MIRWTAAALVVDCVVGKRDPMLTGNGHLRTTDDSRLYPSVPEDHAMTPAVEQQLFTPIAPGSVPDPPEAIDAVVWDIMRRLRRQGIETGLYKGSLLGARRNMGAFPWENDLDVFVYAPSIPANIDVIREAVLGAWDDSDLSQDPRRKPVSYNDFGFQVGTLVDEQVDGLPRYSDVMLFDDGDDGTVRCYGNPEWDGWESKRIESDRFPCDVHWRLIGQPRADIERSTLVPAGSGIFNGVVVPIARDPDRLLESLYGPMSLEHAPESSVSVPVVYDLPGGGQVLMRGGSIRAAVTRRADGSYEDVVAADCSSRPTMTRRFGELEVRTHGHTIVSVRRGATDLLPCASPTTPVAAPPVSWSPMRSTPETKTSTTPETEPRLAPQAKSSTHIWVVFVACVLVAVFFGCAVAVGKMEWCKRRACGHADDDDGCGQNVCAFHAHENSPCVV